MTVRQFGNKYERTLLSEKQSYLIVQLSAYVYILYGKKYGIEKRILKIVRRKFCTI